MAPVGVVVVPSLFLPSPRLLPFCVGSLLSTMHNEVQERVIHFPPSSHGWNFFHGHNESGDDLFVFQCYQA